MASKEETMPFPDSTKNSFSCDECEKVLPNMIRLKYHKQTHANPESVTCNICKKVFAFQASLVRHQSVHTGVRPHKCPVCTMAFTQSSHVKRHMKLVHNIENSNSAKTGNKQNPKKGFGKMGKNRSSGNKQNLKNALRKTGIEYECDVCGSSFKKAKTLKDHKRKHTRRDNKSADKENPISGKSEVTLFHNKKRQKMSTTSVECKKSSDNYKDQVKVNRESATCEISEKSEKESVSENFVPDNGKKRRTNINLGNGNSSVNPSPKLANANRQVPAKPKVRPNQCDICFKTFKQKSYVKDHKRTHTGEKPFSCECGKSYAFKHRLMSHLESGKCPIQQVERSDEGPKKVQRRLGEKKITKSRETKTFQCQFCSKEFKTKGHVDMHERVHTGHRPYQCELCGKSFKQSSHVLIHKRGVHSKGSRVKSKRILKSTKSMGIPTSESPQKRRSSVEGNSVRTKNLGSSAADSPQKRKTSSANKVYKCEFCLKTFKQENQLLLHKRMHKLKSGPFDCQTCGKSFKIRNNLYRHELVHTGEKPYLCEICGKSCSQKSNLKSHVTRVHRAIHLGTKYGELGSEVVSSSSQIHGVQTEVSSVNDGTVNAYTESDKLTNSEELQSKAEGPKSPSCQEVQKDSNCTINKSVELLHSRENDSRVTPPSPRVNKERNLFTELKLRKQYYDEQVNSAAGDENISSEVSDLNNNVNDSKSKAASGFEEDKLSEKPHTVNPKDKQSANLHSKSVGHREQRFHQKSEESSLQDNNSIAKNEPPLPGIATEAKINSTRSCDESTNNFEAADINKGVSDQVSQEKFEGHQLSREVGGGNEKMFVCCECGEKFDDENSMIMHCVDVH